MRSTTTRWWWIRHAPVINPGGSIYGQRDVPADCSSVDVFAALAQHLPRDAVWVETPLSRTRQTALAIRAHLPVSPAAPLIEPDLLEQNFGAWQGRSYAEIGAFGQGTGSGHRFWLSPAHVEPPEGESFVAVAARVAAAIDRLTDTHRGRDLVVVAHGGTIRAALAHALGLSPEVALSFSVDNLSLTRLDRIESAAHGHAWRVAHVNHLSHPARPGGAAAVPVLDQPPHPDREVR